jgi:hypothetical protein
MGSVIEDGITECLSQVRGTLKVHFWDVKGPDVVSSAGFLTQFLLFTSVRPAKMHINTSAMDGP